MQARTVSLVLATRQGRLLGQTPAFAVDLPWWQEMADVVRAVGERFGIRVIVLRLLASERPRPHGGWVAYMAETDDTPPDGLLPVCEDLARRATRSSRGRADWAGPGGHRQSLEWAQTVWPDGADFRCVQRRAWNLSSLWKLEPGEGARTQKPAWLKQVPPFLAHEAAVLGWLATTAPAVSPRLLATDGAGRILLEHIDGDDGYGVPAMQRERFALAHHQIQLASIPALEMLARRGVPERRGASLARHLRDELSGHVSARPRLARFLDHLDGYMARLDACGLPDALVHGDFHPGNVRQAELAITILDWGDSFLGHPAFDLLRLSEGVPRAAAEQLLARWSSRWREHKPGCDPERAVSLIRPLVPLRAAATYAHFVEQIEESEHPFHASDVTDQLDLAERLLEEGVHDRAGRRRSW